MFQPNKRQVKRPKRLLDYDSTEREESGWTDEDGQGPPGIPPLQRKPTKNGGVGQKSSEVRQKSSEVRQNKDAGGMKAGAPGTSGNQAEPVGPGVLTWAGTRIDPAPHSINAVPLQPRETSHITGIASQAGPIQTDATHGADIRALSNQAEFNVPNRDNNQNPYGYTSGPGMPVNQSVYPLQMGQPQTWTPPQWPQPQFTQPQYQAPPQYPYYQQPYYQGPPIPLPSYMPQQSATQTSWPNYTMTSQPIMPQPIMPQPPMQHLPPMQQQPPMPQIMQQQPPMPQIMQQQPPMPQLMQQQPPMPQIMPHPLPMSHPVTMPGNYPALAFHAAPLDVTVGDKIRQQIISNEYIDFAALLGNESSEGSTSASLSYNEWQKAFMMYATVYAEQYPQEWPHLTKYADTIRELKAAHAK